MAKTSHEKVAVSGALAAKALESRAARMASMESVPKALANRTASQRSAILGEFRRRASAEVRPLHGTRTRAQAGRNANDFLKTVQNSRNPNWLHIAGGTDFSRQSPLVKKASRNFDIEAMVTMVEIADDFDAVVDAYQAELEKIANIFGTAANMMGRVLGGGANLVGRAVGGVAAGAKGVAQAGRAGAAALREGAAGAKAGIGHGLSQMGAEFRGGMAGRTAIQQQSAERLTQMNSANRLQRMGGVTPQPAQKAMPPMAGRPSPVATPGTPVAPQTPGGIAAPPPAPVKPAPAAAAGSPAATQMTGQVPAPTQMPPAAQTGAPPSPFSPSNPPQPGFMDQARQMGGDLKNWYGNLSRTNKALLMGGVGAAGVAGGALATSALN